MCLMACPLEGIGIQTIEVRILPLIEGTVLRMRDRFGYNPSFDYHQIQISWYLRIFVRE